MSAKYKYPNDMHDNFAAYGKASTVGKRGGRKAPFGNGSLRRSQRFGGRRKGARQSRVIRCLS